MSFQRNPTSLQVQVRSSNTDSVEISTKNTDDAALLRESQQFRKDMEREVERWMDVIMESPSVDRSFLRRAVRRDDLAWDAYSFRARHLAKSLYLQPNLYDEVLHERHLATMCSYPTCDKQPRRPYSEESKWKITTNTSRNTSLRGPNKRDVVEVAGNPGDGFCGPDCAIRSRWYRSQLGVEPVWARPNVNVGDIKEYQKNKRQGHRIVALPGEVELLEDMEERGDIAIKNGQIQKLGAPTRGNGIVKKASEVDQPISSLRTQKADAVMPLDTKSLPKSELVAETRAQSSTFMQKLESTLASLRIVEKDSITQPSQTQQPSSGEQRGGLTDTSSSSTNTDIQHSACQPVDRGSRDRRDELKHPQPLFEAGLAGYTEPDGPGDLDARDTDFEDGSEDEETRKVFEFALAAREQLKDGRF